MNTIEQGKNRNGFVVRITKRGSKFDVVYCSGFCWKYIAKGLNEQAARSVFFLEVL